MSVVSIEGVCIVDDVREPTYYYDAEFYAVRLNLAWHDDFEEYGDALNCAVKLTLMHGAILEDRTRPEKS